MTRIGAVLTVIVLVSISAVSQTTSDSNFKLALPDHKGQLRWSADGFKVVESSAKPNRNEIGIRGKDASGRLAFLGFLFLFPEQAPLTSAKCRDGELEPEKKANSTLKVLGVTDVQSGPLPVSLVTYTAQGRAGNTVYSVRGFVATADMCGDLEFYSDTPISADEPDLRKIFGSFQLDESYAPTFYDIFLYAQILYKARMYKGAAPVFEIALGKLPESPGADTKTMKRVVTDQAGMAYGMSGNISKARAIFEKGIADDPDYPLYYYNLACADAEERKLPAARQHLQEAFARKANVISGESLPDPKQDDSFLPYRNDKDFWAFLETLH
jgi:tetratricopeptide (TPR) repeat protein